MNREALQSRRAAKDWSGMRKHALDMLRILNCTNVDRAVAYTASCEAEAMLGNHGDAMSAGELGLHYAKLVMGEGGGADLVGEAILTSGFALGRQRLLELAVQRLEEYFAYADHYTTAVALRPKVLLNQGIAYRFLGLPEQAADKFRAAWGAAPDRLAPAVQAVRRNLTCELLNAGQLEAVPDLLACGRQYVMNHPEDREATFDWMLDEGRYLVQTDQASRGARLCATVMREASNFPGIQTQAALVLVKLAWEADMPKQALTLAVRACIFAGQSGREDLQADATRWLREVDALHDHAFMPEVMVEMGQIRPRVAQQWRSPSATGKKGGYRW